MVEKSGHTIEEPFLTIGNFYNYFIKFCPIESIMVFGDLLISTEGHMVFENSDWDQFQPQTRIQVGNDDIDIWNKKVFDNYGQYIIGYDSVFAIFRDENKNKKGLYSLWDDVIVEVYLDPSYEIEEILKDYKKKKVHFPGAFGFYNKFISDDIIPLVDNLISDDSFHIYPA